MGTYLIFNRTCNSLQNNLTKFEVMLFCYGILTNNDTRSHINCKTMLKIGFDYFMWIFVKSSVRGTGIVDAVKGRLGYIYRQNLMRLSWFPGCRCCICGMDIILFLWCANHSCLRKFKLSWNSLWSSRRTLLH